MPISIERGNFTSVGSLIASIVSDLLGNGFTALSLNGVAVLDGSTPTIDSTLTKVLLAPGDTVDPIAVEDSDSGHANFAKRQPWRLAIEVDQSKQAYNIYVCTPTNIIMTGGDFEISTSAYTPTASTGAGLVDTISKSGMLHTGSYVQASYNVNPQWDSRPKPSATKPDTFYDSERFTFRYEYFGFDITNVDRQSIPLSYRLAISNHGIAVCTWIESRDSSGDKFNWFAVQRMVNKDTGAAIVEGKAPLFCVFSMDGGGGADLNSPNPDGVYYFIVRESDVHTPTMPVSATVDTADSARIINTTQQVSISEANTLILSMMKGLNTQRFAYAHELDMIGYVSADVVSQYADIEVTQYGEDTARSFKAMKANHPNNTGMRILMLQRGAGIA